MAVELTRKNVTAVLKSGQPVHVPVRYLIVGTAAVIVITYLALGAGLYTAGKKSDEAGRRYADALQILEAPPASIEALSAELKTVQEEVARLQGSSETSVDPSSDQTTALLVRRAGQANLTVLGISRVAPAQAKIGDISYAVEAIRIGVTGSSIQEITAFLSQLDKSEPTLIASLSTLDIAEDGVVQAELVFSAYQKPEATPVARAPR